MLRKIYVAVVVHSACLTAISVATEPVRTVKAFLSGPVVVTVTPAESNEKVEVCWTRFEAPNENKPRLATAYAPQPGSCPDKDLFLDGTESTHKMVKASCALEDERVRMEDGIEWELARLPSMHFFLHRPKVEEKGTWVAFCTMQFRQATGSSDERKDIFCDRQRPILDKTKAVCPSPSECVNHQYTATKAKLISDPTLIPHATVTETHKSDVKPAAKVEVTTTSRPVAPKK